jgi:phosphoglucosamine mutase
MVDANGEVVDGDELLYIIARHRAAAGELGGGVVGTVMSNFGLERALKDLSIPFERAAVGDRYVLEALRERGWRVGGEASGHIICLDLTTTGDAIVAALQALTPMVEQGVSLHELKRPMSKLPQVMLNVTVAEPSVLADKASVRSAVEEKMRLLDGRGRVLVRPSGTEPVVRVMVEGEDSVEVSAIAEELAATVRQSA